MKEYNQEDVGAVFSLQALLQLIRAVGAILGVVAIVIGLVYVTRIFGLIFGVLHAPDGFDAHLAQWVKAVGGEQLDVVVSGTTLHCARIVAIAVLGGGVTILAWISLGLILAGAKIVSWTLGDREAVRRMLAYAFGSEKKAGKSAIDNHGG